MNNRVFYIILGCLLIGRFFHLGMAIDLPHDWRQCDTAFYIWDFYQNGIDLLAPSVCWMGGYKTVILEFPLPEALVACLYQLVGESILTARLFFLTCFAGAAYFFYRSVQLIWGDDLAIWSVLIYLGLPLSWYYSRAIHIDFSAIFAAHAMLFFYLRGVLHRNSMDIAWAVFACTLAFLIKVPYAFYFALPMFVFTWYQGALGWVMRDIWRWVLPIAAFYLWQSHVYSINSQAPDWDYILHYRTFDDNMDWYFGHWSRRLMLNPWKTMVKRMIFEAGGLGTLLALAVGLWTVFKQQRSYMFWTWSIGVVLYLLIFFNLNIVHNYYQIPFLAPIAILAAMGITELLDWKRAIGYLAFGFLLVVNIAYAELTYFEVPEDLIEIGQVIRDQTKPEDLVVVTYGKMDCRNPRILYRARRSGWSIEEAALNKEVLERLTQEEGANIWVYIGETLPAEVDTLNLNRPIEIALQQSTQRLFITSLKRN